MEALAIEEEIKIISRKVPTTKRLAFLPGKMPKHYLRFEQCVYHFARELINEYNGGFWEFLDLSNGGFYIRPSFHEMVTISVEGNYFNGVVSADAGGVIVCMFALCYMASEFEDDGIIELYYLLRSFINDHPEADSIWRAID